MTVFSIIVDILTISAGVLGIVSISVVGVQYLMAGRNESKVKRAKQRMLEIIVGLTAFAVMTVVLRWIEFFLVR